MNGPSLKILSYNIRRGRSFAGGDVLEKVFQVLYSSQSDVLCLQEVWRDQEEVLHQLEAQCRIDWKFQAFAGACEFPHGTQGNLILSRWDILEWEQADLSMPGRQTRSLVHARLKVPEQERRLSVICLHLGLSARERRFQMGKLKEYLAAKIPRDEPLVLAGDFNDWRKEVTACLADGLGLEEVLVKKNGRHARTFPAILPLLPLDRIYFRNCALRDARLLKSRFYVEPSDHVPIFADFSL